MSEIVKIPKLGLTMEEATLTRWYKNEGERVEKGEIIFEIETDKITNEVESPVSGYILEKLIPEGERIEVLTEACIIGEKDEEIKGNNVISSANVSNDTSKADDEFNVVENEQQIAKSDKVDRNIDLKISPLARRLARENDINLQDIKSDSRDRVITKKDVLAVIEKKEKSDLNNKKKEIPLQGIRKRIASRMTQSKQQIPHIYLKNTVDASEIMSIKKKYEGKVGINDILIKSIALALKKLPEVNISLVDNKIVYHQEINIGLAVSLKEGLIVPVIKQAGKKDIFEISKTTEELIDKARENSLSTDDVSGATFTVSNLGMYDLEEFAAIINPPESGILAVGKAIKKPVVEDDNIVIKPVMQLTLSVDHRIIDGELAARFLSEIKTLLEDPSY